MALKQKTKKKLITESQTHKKDTGSPSVQIRLLTKEIEKLTDHLQIHKKDHSARRGLLGMVAQRRDLLKYLQRENPARYQDVLETNNLKK